MVASTRARTAFTVSSQPSPPPPPSSQGEARPCAVSAWAGMVMVHSTPCCWGAATWAWTALPTASAPPSSSATTPSRRYTRTDAGREDRCRGMEQSPLPLPPGTTGGSSAGGGLADRAWNSPDRPPIPAIVRVYPARHDHARRPGHPAAARAGARGGAGGQAPPAGAAGAARLAGDPLAADGAEPRQLPGRRVVGQSDPRHGEPHNESAPKRDQLWK